MIVQVLRYRITIATRRSTAKLARHDRPSHASSRPVGQGGASVGQAWGKQGNDDKRQPQPHHMHRGASGASKPNSLQYGENELPFYAYPKDFIHLAPLAPQLYQKTHSDSALMCFGFLPHDAPQHPRTTTPKQATYQAFDAAWRPWPTMPHRMPHTSVMH